MEIIYRPKTKAYIVDLVCYPSPDDETIPQDIRNYYKNKYEEIHAYALEHPESVITETVSEPTFDEVKNEKLSEINSKCNSILKKAVATYPETEQQTFYKQDAESAAYLENPEGADTPFLTILAAARGIDLDTMVTKVRAKTDAFAQLSAFICGQRQAMEDKLDTCESIKEIEAIEVNYILPEGYNYE